MKEKMCPECRVEMHIVKTISHYGVPLALDQCMECGGVWFDGMELFQAHAASYKNMEELNVEKFREDTTLPGEILTCPNDARKLDRFKDPNFPKHLQVEHCGKCGGFWMNRGEFIVFNDERKERQKKPEVKSLSDFEKQIDAMLRVNGQGVYYDVMGSLAGFLSTPMNRQTLKPIQDCVDRGVNSVIPPWSDAALKKNSVDPRVEMLLQKGLGEQEMRAEAQKAQRVIQVVWQVVQTLLRLYLR